MIISCWTFAKWPKQWRLRSTIGLPTVQCRLQRGDKNAAAHESRCRGVGLQAGCSGQSTINCSHPSYLAVAAQDQTVLSYKLQSSVKPVCCIEAGCSVDCAAFFATKMHRAEKSCISTSACGSVQQNAVKYTQNALYIWYLATYDDLQRK